MAKPFTPKTVLDKTGQLCKNCGEPKGMHYQVMTITRMAPMELGALLVCPSGLFTPKRKKA